MKKFKIYPPGIFWLCFLGFATLARILPYSFTDNRWMPLFPGIIILICGLAIMYASWNIFRKSENPSEPDSKPVVLISEGPYRFSRNPMYLAFVFILLSSSLILNKIILLLAPLTFIILIKNIFLPDEENNLETNFGTDYQNYKTKVRTWI